MRCTLSANCAEQHFCVATRSDEELVRIGLWVPDGSDPAGDAGDSRDTSIVIWSGPREEILEEGRSFSTSALNHI